MNREWFLRREDLERVFGTTAARQFEEMQQAVAETDETVSANVDATGRIADATVITLSPNADLANERVLSLGDGLEFVLTDGGVTIRLTNVPRIDGGFPVRFVAGGETEVAVPLTGILATRENVETLANKTLAAPRFSGLVNAADDTAAATAGVPVGGAYLASGAFRVRLA